MQLLQQFAQIQSQWTLEEFVEVVNELLPQFLPLPEGETRILEAVNPRLVRHYTTQGLLDKPQRSGREVRYGYRHLLQLLLLRRLLMEGYGSGAIERLSLSQSNAELEALLQGGVQLKAETANPALAFLQQIQQRQQNLDAAAPSPPLAQTDPRIPPSAAAPAAATPPSAAPAAPQTVPNKSQRWLRVEVLPGLELHIREDFVYPSSPYEQQNLQQLIADQLSILTPNRRRSS